MTEASIDRTAIIELDGVGKSYRSADGKARQVLAGVDFNLYEGEVVALLGQSGSGKSTLLRVMAGLIGCDDGAIRYRGQPLYGPARGIAMVFQSFALFPWLTVQQNVELGLEARGVAPQEREQRAQAAIELIGLSGFEGALPRELSGGMRQRVGIARALVVEPDVLLMDEAFSALDVLTGERLRDDILELWINKTLSIRAMLVVSHNIEEAVLMADRILVFGSDPGQVRFQLAVHLPRPRDPDSAEVRDLIDEVYALMTAGATRPGRSAVVVAAAGVETVPGVADVVSFGGASKTYEVQPNLAKLRDYRISLAQLSSALEQSNANAGGGYIEHGFEKQVVRGVGTFGSLDDIARVSVQSRGGVPVTIADLGAVRIGGAPVLARAWNARKIKPKVSIRNRRAMLPTILPSVSIRPPDRKGSVSKDTHSCPVKYSKSIVYNFWKNCYTTSCV